MSKNHADVSGENNPMFGKESANFINGLTKNRGRYFIWIPKEKRRILLSRYVAEQCLYRKLMKEEIIHHINEDKTDDRPENLYVFESNGKHTRQHNLKNPPTLTSNLI